MINTLKLRFGRRPQQIKQIFCDISSSLVRIKIHTENRPPSLLKSGDRYEEDLKIRIWKTTSKTFQVFNNISSSLVRAKLHTKNHPPSLFNS